MTESLKARVLATDMDGTFIPLDGNERNRVDLQDLNVAIRQHAIDLIYVTGRHLELVLRAVESSGLPSPPWLICDVGASIYQLNSTGEYLPTDSYIRHLSEIVEGCDRKAVVDSISNVTPLRLQEEEKQTQFKVSYYCNAGHLESTVTQIVAKITESSLPYEVIASVDPFTGDGLIDLLPARVSKAYALDWWAMHTGVDAQSIMFAGDSGNDLAALTAGYRSIVVGNADPSVVEAVAAAHQTAGWSDRLFVAKSHATSGVLEGFLHFLQR